MSVVQHVVANPDVAHRSKSALARTCGVSVSVVETLVRRGLLQSKKMTTRPSQNRKAR